jgi:Tol biopolymer transport system component/DNA-binding winged helix-turn-helix (wHTH) protein
MEQSDKGRRILRFDLFEVDVEERELRRSGTKVKIQEQPFQILLLLLTHPGAVLAREDLRKSLWPDGTFVDFEHGLNTAVKKLRDALGDSPEVPRFVETVARRGYRFIGKVEIPTATPTAPPGRGSYLPTRRNAVVLGLTLCALGLSFLVLAHWRRSGPAPPILTPAVADVGEKDTPSLSPDGQHLAFAWNGGTGPHFHLYVKIIGTEEPIQLTKQAAIDFNPVWSPDGLYIAFCRILEGGTGIYIIPALGGVERRVREAHWQENEFYQVFWHFGRLSWSPDGKLLAYSDRADLNEPAAIFLLDLDSLKVRRLSSPRGPVGDYNPAFSPDGRTLAFNRSSQGVTSIYTLPVAGGEERHLISGVQYGWGLAWSPDGRDIVFAKAGWLANAGWLWKISRDGGQPERLQFGQEGVEPSIRGNRLVYVRQTANINIWRRELNSRVSAGPPARFIYSTRMESGPQFSPDGSKIAFESTRTGAYEIWMCRSDGSGLIQLTHFNSVAGTPRWSPDGRQIAFDSRTSGNADIFVVDSEGGSPRRLTSERSSEEVPSWSRDGRWIYFASDRTGQHEVWKMPSAGGSAVQITRHGGFAAFESPDGRFLYYAKGLSSPGVWRVPTNGGEEVEIISSLESGHWGYWAVVEDGIYYLDSTAKPGIGFFNVNTRRTTRVFDLDNRPATQAPGLAVSPNKATVLYTQLDTLSRDIMLVENFR